MRSVRTVLVLMLAMWLALPGVLRAQQPSVVDQSTLDDAVAAHAQRADEPRQVITRVLDRQEVREVAARIGVDLGLAQAAVGTLSGAELQRLADQAQAVDSSLAGGQSITITTTGIIIILLLVILIILAAN
jgi:hypothetical protein